MLGLFLNSLNINFSHYIHSSEWSHISGTQSRVSGFIHLFIGKHKNICIKDIACIYFTGTLILCSVCMWYVIRVELLIWRQSVQRVTASHRIHFPCKTAWEVGFLWFQAPGCDLVKWERYVVVLIERHWKQPGVIAPARTQKKDCLCWF